MRPNAIPPLPHEEDVRLMLIGVLLVVAAALLATALLTGSTVVAGVALIVSLGTAVLYVVLLRRAPARSAAEASDAEAPSSSQEETVPAEAEPYEAEAAEPAKAEPAVAEPAVAESTTPESTTIEAAAIESVPPEPATITPIDGAAIVHIVPGRMRYHVDGCQVLDGHDAEALTVDDARDEGFTACSRCAVHGRSRATA